MYRGIVCGIRNFEIIVSLLLFCTVGGGECGRQYGDIYLALAMYFSYFILFANFFRNVYLKRKEAANAKAKAEKARKSK